MARVSVARLAIGREITSGSQRYSFEFHFVLTEGTFTIRGQRSGSAHGTGSFLTQRTPPDLALQCGGDGVSDAPMDMSLATDSPLVSKHAGGGR